MKALDGIVIYFDVQQQESGGIKNSQAGLDLRVYENIASKNSIRCRASQTKLLGLDSKKSHLASHRHGLQLYLFVVRASPTLPPREHNE